MLYNKTGPLSIYTQFKTSSTAIGKSFRALPRAIADCIQSQSKINWFSWMFCGSCQPYLQTVLHLHLTNLSAGATSNGFMFFCVATGQVWQRNGIFFNHLRMCSFFAINCICREVFHVNCTTMLGLEFSNYTNCKDPFYGPWLSLNHWEVKTAHCLS